MSSFRVGQKVVCIKDGSWEEYAGETMPVFRGIYTIRDMETDGDGDLMFRFAEIINPPQDYDEGFDECNFWAGWFRPIVEKKTDIGFAHEILRKVTRKQTVRA